MNKIIVTGHPSSGLAEVEALLRNNGMRPAMPSRREGLTAPEVLETLRVAHQLPDTRKATDEDALFPVEVHPIWNELTMDLLAGNLGREPWGLADANQIFFLQNWHDLVEDALFVFVYAPPSHALCYDGPIATEESTIRQQLDNWAAYNGALLRFYMRHRDRSILVHVARARSDAGGFLEVINDRLIPPLDPSVREADPAPNGPPPRPLPDEIRLAIGEVSPEEETGDGRVQPDDDFLTERIVDDKPEHLLLYSELQAAADLPHKETGGAPRTIGSETWAEWAEERRLSTRLLEEFRSQTEARQQSELRNQLLSLQWAQLRDEHQKLQIDFQHLTFLRENPPPPTGAATMVKEELSYRLGHTLVKRSRNPLTLLIMPVLLIREAWRFHLEQHARGKRPPISEYSDADLAKPVKKQLSYRLGDAIVRNSRTPLGWFMLPFALIRQTTAYRRSRRQQK